MKERERQQRTVEQGRTEEDKMKNRETGSKRSEERIETERRR